MTSAQSTPKPTGAGDADAPAPTKKRMIEITCINCGKTVLAPLPILCRACYYADKQRADRQMREAGRRIRKATDANKQATAARLERLVKSAYIAPKPEAGKA
jgi:hypothetical protein